MSEQKQEIKVNFPEKLHGGVYANNMIVTHTKEEFVMDYLNGGASGGCGHGADNCQPRSHEKSCCCPE